MKLFFVAPLVMALLAISPAGFATEGDAEAGLATISLLGTLNGQALACSEKSAASQAKLLMLAHAPKTQRFGAAYEEATQAAFLTQTASKGACPHTADLNRELNSLTEQLKRYLPIQATEAK